MNNEFTILTARPTWHSCRKRHVARMLDRAALVQLHCEKQLVIVPGATQPFEEPRAPDAVAGLAREWFQHHLITIVPRVAVRNR